MAGAGRDSNAAVAMRKGPAHLLEHGVQRERLEQHRGSPRGHRCVVVGDRDDEGDPGGGGEAGRHIRAALQPGIGHDDMRTIGSPRRDGFLAVRRLFHVETEQREVACARPPDALFVLRHQHVRIAARAIGRAAAAAGDKAAVPAPQLALFEHAHWSAPARSG